MITREMILKGRDYKEEYKCEEYDGKVFFLRALTDGEASEVQQVIMRDLPMEMILKLQEAKSENEKIKAVSETGTVTSISGFLKSNNESNYLICSYGIVDNAGKQMFSVDDVKQFKIGVPAKIASEIKKISGMNEEAAVESASFRKDK